MSATVHTALYKNYFARELEYYGEMECLSVGAHRYPLEINYLEDLASGKSGFSNMIAGAAHQLADKTCKIGSKAKDDVPQSVPKEQYSLVVNIIKAVGVEGTGVLVFVSGIADITELTERFEGMSKYKLYAIHSDLPFEEQEAAFTPAAYNEIKVRMSMKDIVLEIRRKVAVVCVLFNLLLFQFTYPWQEYVSE
jgi:HrpA-like RNA helicase